MCFIYVTDVPNAPVLESVVCNEKSATIKWKPMGDNRSPIQNFVIEYNTSFTPDTWDFATETPATDMSYTVSNFLKF